MLPRQAFLLPLLLLLHHLPPTAPSLSPSIATARSLAAALHKDRDREAPHAVDLTPQPPSKFSDAAHKLVAAQAEARLVTEDGAAHEALNHKEASAAGAIKVRHAKDMLYVAQQQGVLGIAAAAHAAAHAVAHGDSHSEAHVATASQPVVHPSPQAAAAQPLPPPLPQPLPLPQPQPAAAAHATIAAAAIAAAVGSASATHTAGAPPLPAPPTNLRLPSKGADPTSTSAAAVVVHAPHTDTVAAAAIAVPTTATATTAEAGDNAGAAHGHVRFAKKAGVKVGVKVGVKAGAKDVPSNDYGSPPRNSPWMSTYGYWQEGQEARPRSTEFYH